MGELSDTEEMLNVCCHSYPYPLHRVIPPCDPTADDRLYHICIAALSVSLSEMLSSHQRSPHPPSHSNPDACSIPTVALRHIYAKCCKRFGPCLQPCVTPDLWSESGISLVTTACLPVRSAASHQLVTGWVKYLQFL